MDIGAYLERIGHTGPVRADAATLAAVHRAQLGAVPYENLDIQAGLVPSLHPDDLFDKIVRRRRGGYCYELNSLLALVLEDIGLEVTRVRGAVGPRDAEPPEWANHLALLVRADGRLWVVDAGLGDGFLEPLPLEPGRYRQGPFTYTVEPGGDGTTWWIGHHGRAAVPGYLLDTEPRPAAYFEPYHRAKATSPESVFVRTLVAQRPFPDGSLTLRGNALTELAPVGKNTVLLPDAAALAEVLSERFGLALDGTDTAALFAKASAQTAEHLARG
ncbi:arylamine N-acetyltransferase [Nocardiopsis sp. NPDC006139]|uniref:arylamine N-acetyltransferase family protein n=1 Tax=Nocardiopsis TaxID=2013 RepID=UPI00159B1746|nr:arylamine N-acetyltransferase [Nocardiopsis flavescens]